MAVQESLLTLERSGLLRVTPGTAPQEYSFHHSLFQEVAYRSLLRRQRRELHATVGETLEDLHGDDLQGVASELAQHFDSAGLNDKALDYHLAAAEQDLRVYAHQEALAHFNRALAIGTENGSEGREILDVYLKRGRALELSGEHEEAIDNYTEMERRATRLGRSAERLRARIQQALLYCTGSPVADVERGVEIAQRTLQEARDLGMAEAEARALWILLLVRQLSIVDLDEAIEAGERAVALAREAEAPLLQGMIANDLGSAYGFRGRVRQSQEFLAEAKQLMERLDNLPMLANVIANQMIVRAMAGKLHEALTLSDEGFEISERIGNLWGQACSLLYIDLVYAELGDYRKALDAGAQCLQLGKASGFMVPSVISNATQAWIRGHLGLYEEGLAYTASAPATLAGPLAMAAGQLFGVRALLHLERGDLEAAQRALEEGDKFTPLKEERLLHPSTLFINLARARLQLDEGEFERVPDLTLPTLHEMDSFNYRLLGPDYCLLTGEAYLASGNLEAARDSLANGLALAEEMDSQRTLWQLEAAQAATCEAAGDGDSAEEHRRRARSIVRRMADNLAPVGLDEGFLQQPHVQELMGH